MKWRVFFAARAERWQAITEGRAHRKNVATAGTWSGIGQDAQEHHHYRVCRMQRLDPGRSLTPLVPDPLKGAGAIFKDAR